MSALLWELLDASASGNPQRAAVIDASGALSFAELRAEADALAVAMRGHGIGAGRTLGIRIRDGRAFLLAAFAAWRCGAAIVPISHQMARGELDELLAVTPLDAVLEDVLPAIGNGGVKVSAAGRALRLIAVPPRNEPGLADLVPGVAYMRFTSGTTGASKGVLVTDQAVVDRVCVANAALEITDNDVVLCVLPMAFHFLVSVVLYVQAGATIVLCPDVVADVLLDAANAHGATFLYAAPLHIRMLASDDSGRGLGAIRRVVSTSSALPPELAGSFRERFGVPVAQGYGIIEAGLPLVNLRDAATHPQCVGRASPGIEVALLDASGRPAPEGAEGELAVRGPGMFSAYLRPFRSQSEILSDGWFRTGDVGRCDGEGRYTLCGRTKVVINMAGNKVFPEEVEQVLDAHPSVAHSRVRGVPHSRFGETIAAEIVLRDGAATPDVEEVLRFCRKRLSPYKVPATLAVVAEIAETASGKVRRD